MSFKVGDEVIVDNISDGDIDVLLYLNCKGIVSEFDESEFPIGVHFGDERKWLKASELRFLTPLDKLL